MREGYQRVASLADIPDPGCLAVECDGQPIVLVRRGSHVAALENRCPHAGAPLSEGFVEGNVLTCAWHGWSFDIESGISMDDPSASVPLHEAVIEGDDVLVKR